MFLEKNRSEKEVKKKQRQKWQGRQGMGRKSGGIKKESYTRFLRLVTMKREYAQCKYTLWSKYTLNMYINIIYKYTLICILIH